MSHFKLINGDCLEVMEKLIQQGVKVDAVITDPPYGTVTGLNTDGWKNTNLLWDKKLDTQKVFTLNEKILRQNGVMLLFSQEPYTHELRGFSLCNLEFSYPLLWEKITFVTT